MAHYSLAFRSSAEKDLTHLPREILLRILARIEGLTDNPRPVGSLKLRGSQFTYRIRVGDYRIVYDLDEEQGIILVQHVRHRKDAYR